MEIHRLHFADLDIQAETTDALRRTAEEVTIGLHLEWGVIVPLGYGIDETATVRFTGSRSQLEELGRRWYDANPELIRPDETGGQYARRLTGTDKPENWMAPADGEPM